MASIDFAYRPAVHRRCAYFGRIRRWTEIRAAAELEKWDTLKTFVVAVLLVSFSRYYLPPTKKEVYVFARTLELLCLSVFLCARLLRNACMDLDEMLRVDRCRDMDELNNF